MHAASHLCLTQDYKYSILIWRTVYIPGNIAMRLLNNEPLALVPVGPGVPLCAMPPLTLSLATPDEGLAAAAAGERVVAILPPDKPRSAREASCSA
jgi:hypothetical protein